MPPAKKSDNLKKSMAKRLIAFRAENLMSQRDLAALLGISRRALQYSENAVYLPHAKTISLFETLCKQKQAEKLSRKRAKETVNAI